MFPNPALARPASPDPVCALVVDAEEDFDWARPVAQTRHSTDCMRHVTDLHEVVGAYGLRPTYLLTYPVLDDDAAVQLLRRQLAAGLCDVGAQLHPWVNPPHAEAGEAGPLAASYSGNLSGGLEDRKLAALKQRFVERFGHPPTIYRAGRYGFGAGTAALLERHGFLIDTSVAPRTNTAEEGGPDYTDYDFAPFWFGCDRRLLEVPLCRSIVGWGGRWAPAIHRRLSAPALARLRIPGIVTRIRLAERVTLSPEGNDVAAMLRLVRHLRARGQTAFVLSFHSSSLAAGSNPYVRTRADLHHFYDRLSGVLDAMSGRMGIRFVRLAEMPGLLGAASA